MSQDDRDQRGGHRQQKKDRQCDCCPSGGRVSTKERSASRTRRTTAATAYERRAEHTSNH